MRLSSWSWLVVALAVVFPLLRLWPLDGQFYIDWYNHKWLAAYAGEYLRQHGTVPIVINTTEHAGMAYPVFYGPLFYPLLATLTTWIQPGVVVRLVALLVTWLQFRLVTAALVELDVPQWPARGVACLVIWAIYPLTNLYNRSAITEYVATALLTCMVASWFLLVRATRQSDRHRIALGIGLLFALAAGTHPITALYSLPILVLLLAAAYAEHGRDRAWWWALAKALAVPAVLVVTVLAPWLYALRAFNPYLQIHNWIGSVGYDLDSIDHWTTRFSPLPYDSRSDDPGFAISTPYLDAQVSVPLLGLLLALVAVLAWRSRGLAGLRSIAVALAAFAIFTWMSLSPSSFEVLPSIATMLQIAYRLVTYQNLSLLVGVFTLAAFLRRRSDRSLFAGKPLAALLIGCLVLAATGVVIKWQHASTIMHRQGPSGLLTSRSERHGWASTPDQFEASAAAYATPSLYAETTAELHEVRIPIGTGEAFGVPQPLPISLPRDTWIGTNVQAFPWNHLELDGVAIPDLHVESFRFVLHAAAGDHVLALQTEPDGAWLVLRMISFTVLALWFAIVAYLNLTSGSSRRRSSAAT